MSKTTFNISEAYSTVLTDNGKTFIGDLAKEFNMRVGPFVMAVNQYAQNSKQTIPTINWVKPKQPRKLESRMTRTPGNALQISVSRLIGSPMENATEYEVVITDTGVSIVATAWDTDSTTDTGNSSSNTYGINTGSASTNGSTDTTETGTSVTEPELLEHSSVG